MISSLLVDSSHTPLHFYGRLSKLHASICQSHPLTCSWSPHLQLKGCSEGSKCDLRPWSPTASALSPTEILATIITINLRWASLTTFNKNLNLYTYTLKALFCNLPPTSELPQKLPPRIPLRESPNISPELFSHARLKNTSKPLQHSGYVILEWKRACKMGILHASFVIISSYILSNVYSFKGIESRWRMWIRRQRPPYSKNHQTSFNTFQWDEQLPMPAS